MAPGWVETDRAAVDTGVKFNMTPGPGVANKQPFPNLSTLDLSDTHLDMDVKDFLLPLSHNQALSVIKATNCNLSGALPGTMTFNNFPLYWTIIVLRLSHNQITALTGDPREFYLDVSSNPIVDIDSRYFSLWCFHWPCEALRLWKWLNGPTQINPLKIFIGRTW
ncbi:unnamed protein product [Durusdinium trenchii]|uniref:Uncharacterized protein n=1 Tax=Durusdinium trenchii TaxID=1381693 RepID=A0ABP0IER3_9DINO